MNDHSALTPPLDLPVALTGATGYIGGRLAVRLLEAGYRLRCLVRSPRKLTHRPWASDPRVQIVEVDISDREAATQALAGCGAAYYLVHSMIAAGREFAERDWRLAKTFANAAEDAALARIIYLGGMGETGSAMSEHLRSRLEVEAALSSGSVPVTALRAAMIIGSGSASFEILRYLVERLPVMFAPKGVMTESQPIAVRNVLGYLVDCLRSPETVGRSLDIGGPDVCSYRELMRIMADELGLRRRVIVPVPVLSPGVSALWIHTVTPLSSQIARPLAEGLRHRLVVRNDDARRLMPQELLTAREAIGLALRRVEANEVETSWSAAGPMRGDPDWSGGVVYVDERSTVVDAPPEEVFRAVVQIGGSRGWYSSDWLWRLRGLLDRLVGGPGLRRGRRDSTAVGYGEAIDFWRVTDIERNRRLVLLAEMKLPGEASLAFAIEPAGDRSRLIQTARFRPRGLAGIAYWYAVVPFHGIVFTGMLDGIRREAEAFLLRSS